MDLAKLVVKLEMQSAQLLTELNKANGKLAGFEKSTNAALARIDKKFRGIGSGIKGALGVLAGALTLRGIVDASAEAAKNFALLENAVAQAGDAAGGRTAADFARVSKELQNISTYSDDSIQNVQQLLLRFQSIRTDRFDEATKAVLNLSSALGVDLDTAAKLIGKSLSDPEKGMTALAKAGVVLADSQKKAIKSLVDTGQSAKAQGVLLDALEKKFGGAAEAARNNFSGALAGVKNSLNDLMEVDGGLPGATSSLNELAKVLQDPAVKAGADALFSLIITAAAKAAQFIGEMAAGLAILAGKGSDEAVNLDNEIIELQDSIKSLKENNPFPDEFAKGLIDEKTAALEKLTEQYQKLMGLGVAGIETAKAGPAKAADAGPLPKLKEDTDAAAEAADKLQKKLEAAGKSLTESLQTPQEKYSAAVAEADKLLAAHVITTDTWTRALGAARAQLDGVSKGVLEVSERYKDLDEQMQEGILKDVNEQIDAAMETTAKELGDLDIPTDDAEKKLSKFAERAAENMQDILAGGLRTALHDGIAEGAEGALKAFGNMLEEMALQAIAAKINEKIFGKDGEGGILGGLGGSTEGGGGGFWSDILSVFSSRDSGGRGQAGVPVMIGRGAQPEVYVPDTPGTFYPKGSYSAGGSVVQNIHVTGQISQRSARQLALESGKSQRVAASRLG